MLQLPVYLRVEQGAALPDMADPSPFRAVVVVETEVSPDWQALASHWLIRSGCLYMMAWGRSCESWDDSVDMANIEMFEFGNIVDERFVMTTWHADESLHEVFRFSKTLALHSVVELKKTVLLHISGCDREREMLQAYANA